MKPRKNGEYSLSDFREVTKSDQPPGSPYNRFRIVLKLFSVALVSSLGLVVLVNTSSIAHSSTLDLSVVSAAPNLALPPAAYLYHLDPSNGQFITISLPNNSRPADVSVVSNTLNEQIWFSEPGLHRIGLLVYTSTNDYSLTEYPVAGSPYALAAAPADVWFTLPDQNKVGHLTVANSAITLIDLPTANAGLADISIDTLDRIWVTERAANKLALIVISPTLSVTEYGVPGSNQLPDGIALDGDGNVWFSTYQSGYLWRLSPISGEFRTSPPLGAGSSPYRLALDASSNVWATLKNANRIARLTVGTLLYTTSYPIPTANSQPGSIGLDSADRVYFTEPAAAQIGRLTITPTAAFVEYPLPTSDLKLTGLAVANDSIWVTAYRDIHQIFLPLVFNRYNPLPTPFGIQTYASLSASNAFTRVMEAHGRRIRYQIVWSSIEPTNTTPDHYNWASLDASVQTATQSDVGLILTVSSNPGWAASNPTGPVSNTADLQEFIGAAVARYPQVTYWEFYNEPDNKAFFGNNGAAYANMLKAVYPVVKAANPNAQVVMGGLALDWFIEDNGPFVKNFLPTVLSNCSGTCFDAANFHYYPAFRGTWEPYGHDIIGKANYVRQVLATYGYNRPLINTETGWPSSSDWGSPELEARYVPKVFARGLAAGLPMMVWYALTDADSSNPGLIDGAGTPRPAYTAFKALVALLTYAHSIGPIPSSQTGSTYIEGYQFTVPYSGGQKRLDVYWYDCPSMYTWALYVNGLPVDCTATAPLKISAARVAMIDKLGNQSILTDADDGLVDGKVTIPGGVGSSPIYIDYNP